MLEEMRALFGRTMLSVCPSSMRNDMQTVPDQYQRSTCRPPQLYRRWEKAGRDPDWCRQKGLQARSLKFAADVRRQLAAAVSKEADVRNGSGTEPDQNRASGTRRDRTTEADIRNGSGTEPDRNRTSAKRRDGTTEERTVPLRKALCIGFANKLARRMTKHNGYRTMGEKSQLVQVRYH